jgi:hypothetical protein
MPMPYKRKILSLALTAGLLAILYGAVLFFDPQRINERNGSFAWLPAEARDEANRIEVSVPEAETITLVRKNGDWFALIGDGFEVPAKQGRIDDIFRILTERGAFPLRGSSSSSHEEMGLVPDSASRLVIRGGAGAVPMLDLLVGNDDSTGREVFLRRNGVNEFRSGDRLLSSYINGAETAWHDLRLFRDDPSSSVQRIRVIPIDLKNDTETEGDFALVRSGAGWVFEGAGTPDGNKAEEWVRAIFAVQGDYFIPAPGGIDLSTGRITIELGDGSVRTIRAGDPLPGNGEKWPVAVEGSPYLFAVSRWTIQNRLFRTRSSLE